MESEKKHHAHEMALQKRYVDALIKARPGLEEQAIKIADDLVNTGLTPNEAMLLIDLVYSPRDLQGRGQATKLKYFSEAVIGRYGDSYLEKVGKSPVLFRGLLYQIGQAVEMREDANDFLSHSSITFNDTFLFQELGLSAEVLGSYVYHLMSEQGLSEVAAIMRIKGAAAEVERGRFSTLEGILFREEFSTLTSLTMEDDREDE